MPKGTYQLIDRTELTDFDRLLGEKRTQLVVKRIFDFTVSLVGLIVLAPFLLTIALLIKADSKGPVFFRQTRVGREQAEFQIWKFRTMTVDAEARGLQITVGDDSRITKLGHVLRKYKLDELPQLINVLVGDMSFVGPRPEVPKFVAKYDDWQRNILEVRPGITDLASIEYRDESRILAMADDPERAYVEEIMPRKIELNLQYLQKMSLFYDIRLIFRTIRVISR